MTNGRFAVYRNVFALIVEISDYEGETHLQTKRATYKQIRAWVKKHYGLHVSNLAISWTKDLCGLAKLQHKGPKGAHGPYAAELTPEKANAIREAFRWFGIIKSEQNEKKGGRVAALCTASCGRNNGNRPRAGRKT